MNWIKHKVNKHPNSLHNKSMEQVQLSDFNRSLLYITTVLSNPIPTIDIENVIANLTCITECFDKSNEIEDSHMRLKLNQENKLVPRLVDLLSIVKDHNKTSVLLLNICKLINYLSLAQNDTLNCGDNFSIASLKLLTFFSDIQDNLMFHLIEIQFEVLKILHTLCVNIASDRLLLGELFNSDKPELECNWYVLFSLLVSFVHCDGDTGQRSREDLLLLLSLVSHDDHVATMIVQKEIFCPVLAASLSGLFCSLPRSIVYPSDDWHNITDDDICSSDELSRVIVCLDFCNAVIQVSNLIISSKFLDYFYNGFLLSVLAPALHQISIDEVVAATLYLEMFIQRISEEKLLNIFIKFIFEGEIDKIKLINIFINRIGHSHTRMCTATLTLFKTLLDLNSEQVMHELVFRYLLPCNHIMLSQQGSLKQADTYCSNAATFLKLVPSIESLKFQLLDYPNVSNASDTASNSSIDSGMSTNIDKSKSHKSSLKYRNHTVDSTEKQPSICNINPNFDPSYFEYLMNARQVIFKCNTSCKSWEKKYTILPNKCQSNLTSTPKKKDVLKNGNSNDCFQKLDGFINWLDDSFFLDEDSMDLNANKLLEDIDSLYLTCNSEIDKSLENNNEVLDYNVLKKEKVSEVISDADAKMDVQMLEFFKPFSEEINAVENLFTLGPFLTALLNRVERMKINTLYVNIQLTGVVSRLACYPHALLTSLLLSHSLVFQPSVKSLIQVLRTVKQNLEDYFKALPDLHTVVQQAREYLHFRINKEAIVTPAQSISFPSERSKRIDDKRMSINVVEFLFGDRFKGNNSVQYVNKISPSKSKTPIIIENKELIEKKNAIYALLIFCEFVKELAAISQEQSIRLT